MPDTYIRFSDMKDSHPSPIDGANDLLAIAHKDTSSSTGYNSMTVTPNALGGYAVEDQTFANLKTSNKTVRTAINQTISNFANDYDATATYVLDDCVLYEGVLYKCTTAIPTAEAWNSAHWTQIKAVDVGSGGGGSSTLAGLTDTDITSPTDGQVLKYNVTSQKWENGAGGGSSGDHITLTQAEYDALVQAGTVDPNAFYFISDAQIAPHSYSTSEQIVGTWIDGSTVYEKTIEVTSPSRGSNTIQHQITNFGEAVEITGTAIRSDGLCQPLGIITDLNNFAWNVAVYNFSSTDFLMIVGANLTISKVYVTIRYTKSSS